MCCSLSINLEFLMGEPENSFKKRPKLCLWYFVNIYHSEAILKSYLEVSQCYPFTKISFISYEKVTISGKYSKAHTSLMLAQACEIYVICLSYMRCRTCSFKKLTWMYLPLTFCLFCFSISSFIFSFHIYIFIFIWGVINIYVCINMCMHAKSLLSCQTLQPCGL